MGKKINSSPAPAQSEPVTLSKKKKKSKRSKKAVDATSTAASVDHESPVASPSKLEQEIDLQDSSSLLSGLMQALRNEDEAALNHCLSPSVSLETILLTLKELPQDQAFPLLNELTKRLNTDKGYGSRHLIPWVQNLLSIHAGLLLTLPKLEQRLQGLHGVVSQRLKAYSKLQNLKGKMDMLKAQVSIVIKCLL
jgi:hypothetical protein